MTSTLRVQAEYERPANRIYLLRARRKRAEALQAVTLQFDSQESRVLTPQFPSFELFLDFINKNRANEGE